MMKRLTLFLTAIVPLGTMLLVQWGCSPDGSFIEAPASPKAVASTSYDPFNGLDEDDHFANVGDADAYRTYLQIFARRLATGLANADVRAAFRNADLSNITKTMDSNPAALAVLSEGFVKQIGEVGLSGNLADIISGYNDEKAFLAAAEALYGLEVSLVDPKGLYGGNTPIEVYHTPVLDEKDTDVFEGFDPDGNAVTMPFDPASMKRSDSFFFINYDEDFFYREANRPLAKTEPVPHLRTTFLASLDPRNLVVTRAWAHGSHGGNSSIPSCYHGDSIFIARFRFSDAHEGNGTPPEMVFTYEPVHRHFAHPWNNSLNPRSRRYEKADKINTDYPEKGDKYPEIYFHAGLPCVGEVFPSGTSGYFKEDYIHFKWVEEDLWPNPDDKVAKWRTVDLDGNGNIYLHETHHTTSGTPQHAKTNLTTQETGSIIYK